MRYLLQFSYDGSKFHGFQRQNDVRNVQGTIEKTLSEIYNESIVIKGAGRTDAGVHAVNQYAHFDALYLEDNLIDKMNDLLEDIVIKSITLVSNDFHARHSAKNKEYYYVISFDKDSDSNYELLVSYDIDVDKMKEASKYFIGTHQFNNFVAGIRDDYETTIFDIEFIESNKKLIIKFTGVGFYRYMIRNLVGALLDVGKGKYEPIIIKEMLDNYNIEKQLSTARSEGLYLSNIKY